MTARRSYAECDMTRVDLLAVEFACNGTRMHLNPDERVHAVRLMTGHAASSEIAWRICTYEREVMRIMRALGAVLCPLCNCLSFTDDGVLRRHCDFRFAKRFAEPCPMSGQHVDDTRAAHLRRSWTAMAS